MKFTKEEALKYHRQMWTDMEKELGNCPSAKKRRKFKKRWCRDNGFQYIRNNCFLCEQAYGDCLKCAIDWTINTDDEHVEHEYACERNKVKWYEASIFQILALPERKTINDNLINK